MEYFLENKPGECPRLGNDTTCDRECNDDADCRDNSKCCQAGCAHVCVSPAIEDDFVTHQPPPPVEHHEPENVGLEVKTPEEINVIQPEGDIATLRCFATGYPLPTVSWKKDSIVVSSVVYLPIL